MGSVISELITITLQVEDSGIITGPEPPIKTKNPYPPGRPNEEAGGG
jgi:hypothetical protein